MSSSTLETPKPKDPATLNEDATPPEKGKPAPAEKDWASEAEKWKALARQNEARAKANAEKATKFDEMEEQSKTELQKAIEAAEAEKKRATALEIQVLKAQVAAKHNVDARFLVGTTEEELTTCAESLLEWRGTQAPKEPVSTSSKDAGNLGAPIGGAAQLTHEDLKTMTPQAINKARLEGHLNNIMGVS